jgi:glucose/arabinose dehydrogenase
MILGACHPAAAQPSVVDPNLGVRTVVSGLATPTTMVFIGPNDIFVLEKATGKVQRVVNGVIQGAVLDLPVNSNSERGLLGIALHPNFPTNPGVYLYWTESSTGVDTTVITDVGNPNSPFPPGEDKPLGNRVDRFVWDGTALTYDQHLITLHAFQNDSPELGEPLRGNHNGGQIHFGPDGKLYIIIGDNGRRGNMQNLIHGNIQRIFAYGIRNSFGFAFDPISGVLWETENGNMSFDEINRILPGHNGGWIQIMGPIGRLADFKQIEATMFGAPSFQQFRWPPTLIAYLPQVAMSRMFVIPSPMYHYADPLLAWKFELPPAGHGFLNSQALGPQYFGNMFTGGATAATMSGHLFRYQLSDDRTQLVFTDPRLADGVADNTRDGDITESESLLFGTNFGIVTDIQTGPNGNLFVVSDTQGAIYEIFHR